MKFIYLLLLFSCAHQKIKPARIKEYNAKAQLYYVELDNGSSTWINEKDLEK